MATWRRNTFTTVNLNSSFNWEDAIGAGNTYLRCHIRWGFHLDCPLDSDIASIASNIVTYGLCTTVGNGSETRPNPRTQSADQAPPTQRWIYWETRAPVVSAIDRAAGIITFRDSGSTEETSTKGQVLATGLPSGDSLNLSSTWATPNAFPSNANGLLWITISILKKF